MNTNELISAMVERYLAGETLGKELGQDIARRLRSADDLYAAVRKNVYGRGNIGAKQVGDIIEAAESYRKAKGE